MLFFHERCSVVVIKLVFRIPFFDSLFLDGQQAFDVFLAWFAAGFATMLARRAFRITHFSQLVAFAYKTGRDERRAAFHTMDFIERLDFLLRPLAHALERLLQCQQFNRPERQFSDTTGDGVQIADNRAAFVAQSLSGHHAAAGKGIKHDFLFARVMADEFGDDIPRFARPVLVPDVHGRMRLGRDLPVEVLRGRESAADSLTGEFFWLSSTVVFQMFYDARGSSNAAAMPMALTVFTPRVSVNPISGLSMRLASVPWRSSMSLAQSSAV